MRRLSTVDLTDRIRRIQAKIRDRVIERVEATEIEALSSIAAETAGDTIYAVDRVSEEALVELFAKSLGEDTSLVLIAEGLEEEGRVFPAGTDPEKAIYRVIVDPIDGTRGLMYDKRSAWVLTGVAENRGKETSLQDIFLAVQTEIPTRKQYRCDVLWATQGGGANAEGFDRFTGESCPLRLLPSTSSTIEHGFAMISRFFPGGKDVLARLEDRLAEALIGPVQSGKARLFEDQYICTGGQLYELMSGHDRFNADLRPNLDQVLKERGEAMGICCHPYDMCTELIGREMGVIVTDPVGLPLNAPLDTTSPVGWIGYANETLKEQIEPVLQKLLKENGMISGENFGGG